MEVRFGKLYCWESLMMVVVLNPLDFLRSLIISFHVEKRARSFHYLLLLMPYHPSDFVDNSGK